jgi:DNA invertase Pin-like site-specific DNA recombinase
LAAFLKLVEAGKVPKGSYFIIENLDRLSREEEVPACHLLTGILMAGVHVVQLKPELILTDKSNGFDIMRAVMELSRGHGESARKSGVIREAFDKWRRDRRPMTKLPPWLEKDPDNRGKVRVIKDVADTVRLIFRLCISGYGSNAIAHKLNADQVKPIGKGDHWSPQYVQHLLKSRTVLGEFQYHHGRGGKNRKPVGQPIPNFFPRIVEDRDFHAAHAAMRSRSQKLGRPAKSGAVNLFTGLLKDARDGRSVHYIDKKRQAGPSLIPYGGRAQAKNGLWVSFPARIFETAILTCLREVDPQDVLPQSDSGRDVVKTLAAELAQVQDEIGKIKARMAVRYSDALAEVLDGKEQQQKSLQVHLAEVQREQATPLTAAWDDAKGLIEILWDDPKPEEARRRMQSAIRRIVEEVWVLFVSRRRERIAVVQTFFKGVGWRRDFYVSWTPPNSGAVPQPANLVIASTAGPSNRGLYLKDRTEALAAAESLEAEGLVIQAKQYPEALQIVLDHGGSFIDSTNGLQVWCIKGVRDGRPFDPNMVLEDDAEEIELN